ncbi:MAG: hypothetical protein EZS28_009870 [Streblomastix strix]|uniref:Uncharacterized protein n=1 Tax=Streblomastix strix TaxID=222440 RepID=A0A5J4WI08_9EUKA|nr:MAG: hypothetical protein EZS28_009870 [Streblomastix strix]
MNDIGLSLQKNAQKLLQLFILLPFVHNYVGGEEQCLRLGLIDNLDEDWVGTVQNHVFSKSKATTLRLAGNKNKMKSYQAIKKATAAIMSFTNSGAYNKERKENEQPEYTPSLTQIGSSLRTLLNKILEKNTAKNVINIPKFFLSLSRLSCYQIGILRNKEQDEQIYAIRHFSRQCLFRIHYYYDAQVQFELVNNKYAEVFTISLSTAGGIGEEQDEEINEVFDSISNFLRAFHEGRDYSWQPYFPPLPLLARGSEEQIEEEGGSEEIDAQLNNKGDCGNIKRNTNLAKSVILNNFIQSSNQHSGWY